MGMQWKGLRDAAAAGILSAALLAAPAAVAQTTAFSETWEGAALGTINPLGGALANGFTFTADNTWTVVPPTQDAGTGPHMRHDIVNFNGSKWLAWQDDGVENAIDTQLFYSTPVAVPFAFDEVESITFTVDLSPTIVATGGRRSATFYIGSDTNNGYRFQINFRQSASELLTVTSLSGGGGDEIVFGSPANFDSISVGGVYTFVGTITPGETQTVVDMAFLDGSTVIEGGQAVFNAAQMVPLDTQVNNFILRARQRTYQRWDNLLLQFTPIDTGEGEGEGQPEGEGEGEGQPEGEGEGQTEGEGEGEGETPNCPTCVASAVDTFDPGQAACLVVDAPFGSSGFAWSKDGVALNPTGRVSGVNCATLLITALQVSDSGTYRCDYDDGSKAPAFVEFTITVVPLSGVPAAGPLGIGALALALAAAAALRNRRK